MMYNRFAYLYDLLMEDIDYDLWIERLEKLWKERITNPKSVLELACGTGNLTKPLLKKGYTVDAFDISSDMLAVAQNKLNSLKGYRLFCMNMLDFEFNNKYDLAICGFDSLNYILKKEELQKVFNNVYNHLEDGGVFVFDLNTKYKLMNILGNNTFVNEEKNIFYVWENNYNEKTGLCDFYLNFFIEKGDKTYERVYEHHIQRSYSLLEIQDFLTISGFEEINIIDEQTDKKSNDTTQRVFVVAKK